MTQLEINSFSTGNITLFDRIARVVLGLAVLIGALFLSIVDVTAFTWTKAIAALVVLSGIAGWDPFYALFRTLARLFNSNGDLPKSSYNPS